MGLFNKTYKINHKVTIIFDTSCLITSAAIDPIQSNLFRATCCDAVGHIKKNTWEGITGLLSGFGSTKQLTFTDRLHKVLLENISYKNLAEYGTFKHVKLTTVLGKQCAGQRKREPFFPATSHLSSAATITDPNHMTFTSLTLSDTTKTQTSTPPNWTND